MEAARVFVSCLDLSPPLVVRLINTLFESKHPLDSAVSISPRKTARPD